MRFSRDLSGLLIDAEIIEKKGNFLCPICHNLSHWRKQSGNLKSPHFYHAIPNEDCPLSVVGGTWQLKDDENVEYHHSEYNINFFFMKKEKPNLSEIIKKLSSDPEINDEVSEFLMKIRLQSIDVSQLDYTVSIFCDFFRETNVGLFCAIPLPTEFISNKLKEINEQRIHRRLIHVIGTNQKMVQDISFLNIPEKVDVEFGTLNIALDKI